MMASPLPPSSKLVSDLQQLTEQLVQYRRQKKRIVLTQGSFDMVHIGHGRYCQQAKTYGDVLIVGIDSDDKIKHRKGEDRPVVPEAERQEMLTYFESVDHVILKQFPAPKWQLIKLIKPDVLIATKETYTKNQLTELKAWCGQVVVLEPMATTSTSAKLRLLQFGMAKKMANKLTDRLRDKLTSSMEEVLKELREDGK